MNTYQTDRDFLAKYYPLVELKSGEKRLLLAPSLQGRVMTSSAEAEEGSSYGWINYKLISSGDILPHCNNWGGEDRFWFGPEGGQFAMYFAPGSSDDFDFEDWQAPAIIDTEGWDLISQSPTKAHFSATKLLVNRSGTKMECRFFREVALLDDAEVAKELGIELGQGVNVVGFSSLNRLTNIGSNSWDKSSGAPSIWMLGQFNPSSKNEIIIPVKESDTVKFCDDYFGTIPADRLRKEGNCYYFTADGNMRGKVGTPPEITLPMAFALDQENEVLTVVKLSFDESNMEYVNSQWRYQEEPFKGDVINAYNDGPLEDGTVMGGFYEIESSSPALFLKAGESGEHRHTTIHIKGELSVLKSIFANLIDNL